MTKEEFIELAEKDENFYEAIDELVYDFKACEATMLNNRGLDKQWEYLEANGKYELEEIFEVFKQKQK